MALQQELTARLAGHTGCAVTSDGTSATLLLNHEDGTPVTAAQTYGDTRASDFGPLIGALAPATSALHAAWFSLAKLLYLR